MGRRLAGAALAGLTAIGVGGCSGEVFNHAVTVILTPNLHPGPNEQEIPLGQPIATLVCPAEVTIEACDTTTMLGSSPIGDREVIPRSKIPIEAEEVVVASEERDFYSDPGVSGSGIVRAILVNGAETVKGGLESLTDGLQGIKSLRFRFVEGASSITQLDVRARTGLEQADTLAEKKHEAELAMGLEIRLEKPCAKILGLPGPETYPESKYPADVYAHIRLCVKDQVMTDFLNRAYFGRDAYGIQEAAKKYFDKTAEELTRAEVNFVVATLQSPSNTDFVNNTKEGREREEKKHHERYDVITDDLFESGQIDDAERDQLHKDYDAVRGEVVDYVPSVGGLDTTPARAIAAEHVTERTLEEAAGKLNISMDDLLADGFKVLSTIDTHTQSVAADIVRLANHNDSGYQVAMTAIAKDGRVLAQVGGLDRSVSQFNLATSGNRDNGSSNKIYITAMALENGHNPEDVMQVNQCVTLLDADSTRPDRPVDNCGNQPGKSDFVVDDGDGCQKLFGTPPPCEMNFKQAAEISSDTFFTNLIGEVGTAPEYGSGRVYEMINALGGDMKGTPRASVSIGAGGQSTYGEAAAANSLLNNEGTYVKPFLVQRIYDKHNNLVYDHATQQTTAGPKIVEGKIAVQTLQIMRAPVEGKHGTAYGAFETPANTVSAKTGTGTKKTDVWTTGVASDNETGGIAFSFWMGNPEEPTRLPDNISSNSVARLAGAFVVGIGAAVDGSQLETEPQS